MPIVGGCDVSRETFDALQAYASLTAKWTEHINLIAKSTVSDLWDRHIVDSAQLYTHAPTFCHWVDIGSGGGFPGLVMAIIAREKAPEGRFTFIESDARKCTFLRTAVRELGLHVTVLTSRIDRADPQGADSRSARALASLSDLLPLADRHLNPQGTALFMKGRRYQSELSAISADWTYEFAEQPSITDPQSRILRFKGISCAA